MYKPYFEQNILKTILNEKKKKYQNTKFECHLCITNNYLKKIKLLLILEQFLNEKGKIQFSIIYL